MGVYHPSGASTPVQPSAIYPTRGQDPQATRRQASVLREMGANGAGNGAGDDRSGELWAADSSWRVYRASRAALGPWMKLKE